MSPRAILAGARMTQHPIQTDSEAVGCAVIHTGLRSALVRVGISQRPDKIGLPVVPDGSVGTASGVVVSCLDTAESADTEIRAELLPEVRGISKIGLIIVSAGQQYLRRSAAGISS